MSSIAHACNGNHSAKVKLLKLGSVLSIQVANFRNVCEMSELCPAEGRRPKSLTVSATVIVALIRLTPGYLT
jgi:hypothetical protein